MIEPGSRLGPYQILAPLGAGGMGEVYRARDPRLERDVAIKVLPEHLMADGDALARFEREAKALAALQHPNILAIHDVGREGGLGYLVTELLEGSTLRERLRQGRIPPAKAAEFGAAIAHGLAAAHGRNLIHRDLKPENIFITKEGRVKILDFGLAKPPPGGLGENAATQPLAGQPLKTAEGVLLGTVGYMSPEQVQGQPLDPRSDLFSLGVVLHEMLSGERPFSGPSAIDTLHAILRNEPPDLASLATGVPPALSRIVHRCLEKEPEQRSQSARDLAFELETLSLATAERPVVGPAPGARSWAWLAGLAALGVGLLLWWKWPAAPAPQPAYRQLTYRRGSLISARFTPDGGGAIYSAAWDGGPMELFQVRLDERSPRSLGVKNAKVQSVNASGEILVTLSDGATAFANSAAGPDTGTLAVLSTEGGTPKEILKNVHAADFAPDGKAFAVAFHPDEGGIRLDYPLGHKLVEEAGGEFIETRVSPDGRHIAVLRQPTLANRHRVLLVDPSGKRRDLLEEEQATPINGMSWSGKGDELYFSRSGALWAMDMNGRERMLRREAVREALQDVSRLGSMLLVRRITQISTLARRGGQELDLSLSPRTRLNGLSDDGRQVLLNDMSEDGIRKESRFALRGTDGTPPKFLGRGHALELHPQATWTLVSEGLASGGVTLVPTGPGLPREIGQKGFTVTGAFFSATGRSLMIFAIPTGGAQSLYRAPLDGGPWTHLPIDNEGITLSMAPDDSAILAEDKQRRPVLRPLDGGADQALGPPLKEGDGIYAWDGQDRLVVGPQVMRDSIQMDLIELKSGRRSPWQQISLKDAPGSSRFWGAVVSRDLSTVVYSVDREIASDLFVAEGLK